MLKSLYIFNIFLGAQFTMWTNKLIDVIFLGSISRRATNHKAWLMHRLGLEYPNLTLTLYLKYCKSIMVVTECLLNDFITNAVLKSTQKLVYYFLHAIQRNKTSYSYIHFLKNVIIFFLQRKQDSNKTRRMKKES